MAVNIIFRKFYHTTPEAVEVTYENEEQIAQYINSVYKDVTERLKSKREYDFTDKTYDAAKTLKDMLSEVINTETRNAACQFLAGKLKYSEDEKEKIISKTGKEIQRGLLLFLYAEDAGQHKLIITKADDTSIIENGSGTLRNGVPKKKRVFKSFVVDVAKDADGNYVFTNLFIYDSMTSQSQYWWQDFLLLEEHLKNDQNTTRALQTINAKILNYVQKKSSADYHNLSHIVYATFNMDGEYDNEVFANDVIGNYQPVSTKVDIEELKRRATEMPSTGKFDPKFRKDVKAARSYKKETVELTDNIDLVLKAPTAQTMNDIRVYTRGGAKYIEIRTDKGYDRFHVPQNNPQL